MAKKKPAAKAIPMPNRLAAVKAICARYPQTFGPPDETLDSRRRLLMPILCRELNKQDGDNWFLLNRLDRNDDDPKPGRLTSDVLVWGPTKEHVDVLSSSGAMWGPQPVITDPDWKLERWDQWPSWDDANPAPAPTPDSATHRYDGGGHDTGICDTCGQPRAADVHKIPESTRPHVYDGGEQDTGVCDVCGLERGAVLHREDQPTPTPQPNPEPEPTPVPEPGGATLESVSDQLDDIRARQDRPLFPVPTLKDGPK